MFSQESSNCCSNHSPKPCLLGCPLSLTLCTLEAGIAICLASLWVPFTAPLLGLRVLGSKQDTNMYLPPSGSNPKLPSCPPSEPSPWPALYLAGHLVQFPCPRSGILSLNLRLGTELCYWQTACQVDCLHLDGLAPHCFRWLGCLQTKPSQSVHSSLLWLTRTCLTSF